MSNPPKISASIMPRPIAKRQALSARRAFYSATQAIDVIISGDLNDAEFAEAVQPFIEAAGILPVSTTLADFID